MKKSKSWPENRLFLADFFMKPPVLKNEKSKNRPENRQLILS
jgi:hypothetical protein